MGLEEAQSVNSGLKPMEVIKRDNKIIQMNSPS